MQTAIISGACFVEEALLGIGLSYGLTSNMECGSAFYMSPVRKQLMNTAYKLAHKQGGHNKFLETITFTLDITAPRYWWQEFDTYRVGVTKQSESTMHTIMVRPLTDADFENGISSSALRDINTLRDDYLGAAKAGDEGQKISCFIALKNLLPEGFLQRRTVVLNAKTLQNMYNQRKTHRLPEWKQFFVDIAADLYERRIYTKETCYFLFGDEMPCLHS